MSHPRDEQLEQDFAEVARNERAQIKVVELNEELIQKMVAIGDRFLKDCYEHLEPSHTMFLIEMITRKVQEAAGIERCAVMIPDQNDTIKPGPTGKGGQA